MDNQALGKAVIYRRKGEQGRSNTVNPLINVLETSNPRNAFFSGVGKHAKWKKCCIVLHREVLFRF